MFLNISLSGNGTSSQIQKGRGAGASETRARASEALRYNMICYDITTILYVYYIVLFYNIL